ncbi:serine hydrolase domain-containing protein [Bacillus sp. FJAT-28004]|uniref:serine hydrolase domain-containing protein n=1 Tax=Bacillus sp. FJAT-28004 TaxID=1679165 RepID=UPI0006B444C1
MKLINKKTGWALTATALLVGALTLPTYGSVQASQTSAKPTMNKVAESSKPSNRNVIKQHIDESVKSKYIPGIVAAGLQNGKKWTYASGKASLEDSIPMESHFSFRVGSVAKTFVAVVVLQLVEENKISLDDSVEKWLPGVVQGNGYDGNKILIRHLLNHRSGIASYTDNDLRDIVIPQNPFRYYATQELVDMGLAKKPIFEPGTDFHYSNTNTVLVGLIIEKITGETYAEQIKSRIIEPLHLTGTSLRGSNPLIPGEHARGYNLDRSLKLYDLTDMNPSWANAAGDMVSTAKDLTTFMSALLGGELLDDEMMKQMLTAHDSPFGGYGLGIIKKKLSDGGHYWAAGGGIHGYSTLAGGPLGGKHIMVLNTNAVGPEVDPNHDRIFDKEFTAK